MDLVWKKEDGDSEIGCSPVGSEGHDDSEELI